jgi:DNA polymerase-1
VLQAIRDEHEIMPKIERWRELTKLAKTYLDVLPELVDDDARASTRPSTAGRRADRAAVEHQPEHAERPDPHPLGREIRAASRPSRAPADLRRLLADRAARARAHRRRGRAEGDLRARRGRPHGDRLQVFGVAAEEIDPGMRSKAKMINYGIVYGLSDYGLADRLNIPREEAKEFIERLPRALPAVGEFIAETIEQGTEHGYVSTLWGRRRQIPELRRATTRCASSASASRSTW